MSDYDSPTSNRGGNRIQYKQQTIGRIEGIQPALGFGNSPVDGITTGDCYVPDCVATEVPPLGRSTCFVISVFNWLSMFGLVRLAKIGTFAFSNGCALWQSCIHCEPTELIVT